MKPKQKRARGWPVDSIQKRPDLNAQPLIASGKRHSAYLFDELRLIARTTGLRTWGLPAADGEEIGFGEIAGRFDARNNFILDGPIGWVVITGSPLCNVTFGESELESGLAISSH